MPFNLHLVKSLTDLVKVISARALYCSASRAIRDSGFAPGRSVVRGATHNWPSVIRVREGLAGRDVLVSSRTSDSCGGPGAAR